MFGVSFEEIAGILGRSPTASRQLASRARRRVHGAATASDADFARKREVVDAFLAAAREGNFDALLAVLDPDVVLRADATAQRLGAKDLQGATAVANRFKGGAQAARPVLFNGAVAAVWIHQGRPRVVFDMTIEKGKIVAINLIGDPERIEQLGVEILDP